MKSTKRDTTRETTSHTTSDTTMNDQAPGVRTLKASWLITLCMMAVGLIVSGPMLAGLMLPGPMPFGPALLWSASLDAAPSGDTTSQAQPNTLTAQEVRDGWKLLFDGNTMNGWRGAYLDSLPVRGWEVKDGMLIVQASGGGEAAFGGDLVTKDQYSSFELKADFLLSEGANSGIKYFVVEGQPRTPGSAIGLEYQLLDDARHPDATKGINGNRTLASLYDLMPARNKHPHPIGQWNEARILVKGKHVEHWLNGEKVLEYERGGPLFLAHKAESKFRDRPGFGEAERGHILLQDHGNRVCFRNIKIRTL